jgi:Ca2+:H+ antiporter
MLRRWLPLWTWLAPLIAWALLGAFEAMPHPAVMAAIGIALIACVLAAVHHAEIVAHRLGQPLGGLVLALAVTVIEVALIVALMLPDPAATTVLPRDTIFAEIMIILNGMVGLCLMLGGSRHGEQVFGRYGVSAALATLATLSVMILILPNATIRSPGPTYSPGQLAFVGIVTLVLYLVFVFVQTVRHSDYFVVGIGKVGIAKVGAADEAAPHGPQPSNGVAAIASTLLLAALAAVVLSAHDLAPTIEAQIDAWDAPRALLGIVIGLIVLLPESLTALKAALADRLQLSLNLALGSALASIGLTIPTVAGFALWNGWTLALGLDLKEEILLALSLLVATSSLGTGRTTVMQGAVHLVIFAVYLFTAIVP